MTIEFGQPSTTSRRKVQATTLEAAAFEAATAHVVNRPDVIRARAQNAATISAAVATALGAFGALVGLSVLAGRWPLLLALLTALSAWLVSMWLYIDAIGYSREEELRRGSRKIGTDAASAATEEKRRQSAGQRPGDAAAMVEEFEQWAGRMRVLVARGIRSTRVAIGLTLIAVLLLATYPLIDGKIRIEVSLAESEAAAIARKCEWKPSKPLIARVRPSELTKSLVALDIDSCSGNDVTIRVRQRSILATYRFHETK